MSEVKSDNTFSGIGNARIDLRSTKYYGSHNEAHTSKLVTITPDIAERWLGTSTDNRPINKRHVGWLAREIASGNWKVNGQPIVISDKGLLLDGQHRLSAIILCGIAIKSFVIYGVSEDVFTTIDTGRKRSAADVFSILGIGGSELSSRLRSQLTNACRWSIAMDRGFLLVNTGTSNAELATYAAENIGLSDCLKKLNQYPMLSRANIQIGLCASLYYHFAKKDQHQADVFMSKFFAGEHLESSDCEYYARNTITKGSVRRNTIRQAWKGYLVIQAWNTKRRGRVARSRNIYLPKGGSTAFEIV